MAQNSEQPSGQNTREDKKVRKYTKGDVVWVRGIVTDFGAEDGELSVAFDDSAYSQKCSCQIDVSSDLVRPDDDIVDFDVDLNAYPLPLYAITAYGRTITVQEKLGEDHFVAFDHATGNLLYYDRRGVYRNLQDRVDLPGALRRYSPSRQHRIVAIRKPVDVDPKPTSEY